MVRVLESQAVKQPTRLRVSILGAAVFGLIAPMIVTTPANAATAVVSAIELTVVSDGTAPFDSGYDDGPNNGIAPTADQVKYKVTSHYDVPGDARFSSVLPAGMRWDASAAAGTICNGPGGGSISADRRTLTCNRTSDAPREDFDLIAWTYDVGNGVVVAPEIQAGGKTAVAPGIEVRGEPRVDLITYADSGIYGIDVQGQRGFQWNVAIQPAAPVPLGSSIRGLETPASPITFRMNVSPGVVVLKATSGLTLSQPGGPGTQIEGKWTTPLSIGDARSPNGSLPRNYQGYAAPQTITLGVPYDPYAPSGTTTRVSSQLVDFDPPSVSGASNYGNDYSPTYEPGYVCPGSTGAINGNQTACSRMLVNRVNTLSLSPAWAAVTPVGGQLAYLLGDGHRFSQRDEKVVPGQAFQVVFGQMNTAASEDTTADGYGCVAWNPETLNMQKAPDVLFAATGESSAFYADLGVAVAADERVIEYMTRSFDTEAARRDFVCGKAGDASAGWYASLADIPEGEQVSGFRYFSSRELPPASGLGVRVQFARTTTPASYELPVNTPLPVYVQYGTRDSALVKSSHPGTAAATRHDGITVQTAEAMVRHRTVIDRNVAAPGDTRVLTVSPYTIGPVGEIPASTAKDVHVNVALSSTCVNPVVSSLDATGIPYVITPAKPGPDGVLCTADDGLPAVIDFQLGAVEAPSGTGGGAFWNVDRSGHQRALAPFTFQVQTSVSTPSGLSTKVKTVISSASDPSTAEHGTVNTGTGPQTDRTEEVSFVTTGVSSFKGNLTVATANSGYLAANEAGSYTLNWGNGTTNDMGQGKFVTVLPFEGDPRGTQGLNGTTVRVQSVTTAMENPAIMGGVGIEYSTDPAATIYETINVEGNESGEGGVAWRAAPVPTDGTATALRFTTEKPLLSGWTGHATIKFSAPQFAAGGKLVNDLFARTLPAAGTGAVSGFRAVSPVTVASATATISGTVMRDADFDGQASADDVAWPVGASVVRAENAAGLVASANVDSAGRYEFSTLAAGTYTLSLQPAYAAGWTQLAPQNAVTVTIGERRTAVNLLLQQQVPATLVDDEAEVTQGGSAVTIDVTANDTIVLPDPAANSVDLDGIAGGTLQAERGSVSVVAPGAGQRHSSFVYAPPAAWPTDLADAESLTDEFSYVYTNPVGEEFTAQVVVTVARALADITPAVVVTQTGSCVAPDVNYTDDESVRYSLTESPTQDGAELLVTAQAQPGFRLSEEVGWTRSADHRSATWSLSWTRPDSCDLATVAGNVWRDADFDGVQSAEDVAWPAGSAIVRVTTAGGSSFTAAVNEHGEYRLADLPADTYALEVQPLYVAGWTQLLPAASLTLSAGQNVLGADLLLQQQLPTSLVDDEAVLSGDAESIDVDVTANDAITVPAPAAASIDVDGVSVGATRPTRGSVVVAGQGQDGVHSVIRYARDSAWPADLEDEESYVDTFSYVYTDALGNDYEAMAEVTVHRNILVVQPAVSVTQPDPCVAPVVAYDEDGAVQYVADHSQDGERYLFGVTAIVQPGHRLSQGDGWLLADDAMAAEWRLEWTQPSGCGGIDPEPPVKPVDPVTPVGPTSPTAPTSPTTPMTLEQALRPTGGQSLAAAGLGGGAVLLAGAVVLVIVRRRASNS